jgi:hypothetical protein
MMVAIDQNFLIPKSAGFEVIGGQNLKCYDPKEDKTNVANVQKAVLSQTKPNELAQPEKTDQPAEQLTKE